MLTCYIYLVKIEKQHLVITASEVVGIHIFDKHLVKCEY